MQDKQDTKRLRHHDVATEWRIIKEPGVGRGNGKGSGDSLERNRNTIFVCAGCSFFVYWMCASRGRDVIAAGDGCASRRCCRPAAHFQVGRFVKRQRAALKGLAEGSLHLVATPSAARDRWETVKGGQNVQSAAQLVCEILKKEER